MLVNTHWLIRMCVICTENEIIKSLKISSFITNNIQFIFNAVIRNKVSRFYNTQS